jgi:hypothetical protein
MKILVVDRKAMPGWKRWALAQRNEVQGVAGFSPGFVLLPGLKPIACALEFTGLKPGASTLRQPKPLAFVNNLG